MRPPRSLAVVRELGAKCNTQYLRYLFAIPCRPVEPAIGVAELTAALKRCLRSRGMTYAELGKQLRLSEASVKRVFSARSFTLKRMEAICGVLGLDFYELAPLPRSAHRGRCRLGLE